MHDLFAGHRHARCIIALPWRRQWCGDSAPALRLATIRWIFETPQRDEDRCMPASHFLERLKLDLGDYAESQLQAAISWGRYAERFAFDDDSDEMYLES
jgi:hypothetical protein